jgi:hypothetical protein
MTIHTPLDSPCRVYKKSVVFGKFYINYWSKISQKPHFNILNPKKYVFFKEYPYLLIGRRQKQLVL